MAGFPAMSDNVSRNKHINFYRHHYCPVKVDE